MTSFIKCFIRRVKITSADFVPELVFQPVKITSADSAGQCYKKLYKGSLLKKISMKSFLRSFVRRFVRSFIRSLIDKLYKVLYKELLMGVPEIVFQPVKRTSADSVPKSFSCR